MAGRIQGADVKTEAELVSAGADKTYLPRDTQIYVTALGINKTLDDAITDGDIGGSGGGGVNLNWVQDTPGPILEVDSGTLILTARFVAAITQSLVTGFRVPDNYQAGKPIKLKLPFYSNDTTGNVLMQTVATLIRNSTDVVTTTTNQRTSTNSAVTLGAGTQNETQTVTFDLTDTSGQINSVAVAVGDFIKIQLKRGTDTAVSDANVWPDAYSVTLT